MHFRSEGLLDVAARPRARRAGLHGAGRADAGDGLALRRGLLRLSRGSGRGVRAERAGLANLPVTIAELCKGVHCVDLGESFQTHILLQNLASIQPRTSPVKFEAAPVPQLPRAGVQLDQVPHHVRRRTVPAHANPEAFDCLAFCSKLSMALSGISGNTAENGAKSSRHFLRADGSFGALLVRHGRSWKTMPFPRRIAGM